MNVRCGIDMVKDIRMQALIDDVQALEKVFHTSELSDLSIKKIAGYFALKEAVCKALDIATDYWLDIEIQSSDTGKPIIKIASHILQHGTYSIDASVSHEAGMTIGMVVIIQTKSACNTKSQSL
jgi:holo-[acyl-carrier-protein] synthase